MGRKLTTLTTLLVLPGGLALLIALLVLVAAMRSARGRRLVVALRARVPRRIKAVARPLVVFACGEDCFLLCPLPVHLP